METCSILIVSFPLPAPVLELLWASANSGQVRVMSCVVMVVAVMAACDGGLWWWLWWLGACDRYWQVLTETTVSVSNAKDNYDLQCEHHTTQLLTALEHTQTAQQNTCILLVMHTTVPIYMYAHTIYMYTTVSTCTLQYLHVHCTCKYANGQDVNMLWHHILRTTGAVLTLRCNAMCMWEYWLLGLQTASGQITQRAL